MRSLVEQTGLGRVQRGMSLIEILVALVIVSVGLLGMAGLQAYSIRNNNSAYQRSQANTLAYDILDCVRTDLVSWRDGRYCYATNESLLACPSGSVEPPDNSRAERDLQNWAVNLYRDSDDKEGLLPYGAGMIDCDTNWPVCTVIVQWDDTRGVGAPQQFIVSTRL